MTITDQLRGRWRAHGPVLLAAAIVLMAALAAATIPGELRILTADPMGGVDLRFRHFEVQEWFAGRQVYGRAIAGYQPAAYVLLWPLLGWLPWSAARGLTAALMAAAFAWLAWLMVRESGAAGWRERLFLTLALLSANATGVTLTGGQLIPFLLPPLIVGLIWLARRPPSWRTDLGAAALILLAFIKPTLAAPFFWLALFVPGRRRPAALIVIGYALLTVIAACFQDGTPWELLHAGLAVGLKESAKTVGYGHLHLWLHAFDLDAWKLPASLIVLAALGLWVRRHRRADLWVLLGVVAIVGRVWVYHRVYDDLLLVLPLVALFRLARRGPDTTGTDVAAGTLFTLTLLTLFIPTRVFYRWPAPWPDLFAGVHVLVWALVLVFLAARAPAARGREGADKKAGRPGTAAL